MGLAGFMVLFAAGCGRVAFEPFTDGAVDTAVDAVPLGAWNPPTPVVLPTTTEDDDPSLTDDLLELYFNRGGGAQIFSATRTAVGQPWSIPILVPELNSAGSNTLPEVTGDGLTIYFSSNRAGGTSQMDIWRATRDSRSLAFGALTEESDLNTTGNEYGASMSADQRTIVTSSETNGSLDLFTSSRSSPAAAWSAPTVFPTLATLGEENEPFLSRDGLTLYYTGPDLHIHVTTRASLSEPFTAGAEITELSSLGEDRDPWVSADGRYIMFASNRSGPFQLWEATR